MAGFPISASPTKRQASHVTVGEIVCSKRFHFVDPYMEAVIERLQQAGRRR